MHRLRLGVCKGLNNFLCHIGKHPNGMCDTCNTTEDVDHFLIKCKKFNMQRQSLQKALGLSNAQMHTMNREMS